MKAFRSFVYPFLLIGALLLLAACDLSSGGPSPAETTAATTTAAPATTEISVTAEPPVSTAPASTEPPVSTAPVTTVDTLTALAPYITLSREEYYGLSVTLPGKSTVSDADVEQYIEALRVNAATTYREIQDGEVAEGDAVYIFYRGEIEQEGRWVEFVGGSNQASLSAQRLVIGSGHFIPGFEEGLVGLPIGTTSLKLSTDASHMLGEGGSTVGYVTYKVSYGGAAHGSFADRVDLSAEGGRYGGSALLTDLTGKGVGAVLPGPYTLSFDITGDLVPEEITVTDVKLTRVVTEEKSVCLEMTFPEAYHSAELAGKAVRFHVIVMATERPELPELNAELITGTFGVTPEQLAPFLPTDINLTIDEQVITAFTLLIRDMMEEDRKTEIREATLAAFWQRMAAVTVKAYPESLLTEAIADIRAQLEEEHAQYMAQYGEQLSLEEYVLAMYTMPDGVTDLDGFLTHFAKSRVKQRLVLFYIAAAEGWEMTAAERAESYDTYMQELVDYYNDYYGGMLTVTREDLVSVGYTEEYVCEQLLYERVCEHILESMREHVVFEGE